MFIPHNTVFGSITYQYIYVIDFMLLVLSYVVKYWRDDCQNCRRWDVAEHSAQVVTHPRICFRHGLPIADVPLSSH